MGPDNGMLTAAERNAERDKYLGKAEKEFPGWDFLRVFGGWEAVPKGTPVIRSVDLEGLMTKLREAVAPEDTKQEAAG